MDNRTLKLREKILQTLKSQKRDFVKRYGEDAEKVMYGVATKRAEQEISDKAKEKLKEAVISCLSASPSNKLLESDWDDPYMKDNDIWDYDPTAAEIEAFKRSERGLPPKSVPQKKKYTGRATLQVNQGLNKWQDVKEGPIGLIKSIYNNLPNKSNYRIIYHRAD